MERSIEVLVQLLLCLEKIRVYFKQAHYRAKVYGSGFSLDPPDIINMLFSLNCSYYTKSQ